MNEEEKKAAAEQAVKEGLGVTLEEAKGLIEKAKTLEPQFKTVVDELKTERQKKQAAEAERDLLKTTTPPPATGAPDVDATVRAILAEESAKKALTAKQTAEQKFKQSHKEFHPENDPGGIKYSLFQEKLKELNLDGVTSEEDYLKKFETAQFLLTGTKPENGSQYNPYASTSQYTSSIPKEEDKNKLDDKERKLIKQLGWDEARYLKQKASRPSYVQSLLADFK